MGIDNTQTSQAGQSDRKMMYKCSSQHRNISVYSGWEAVECGMLAEQDGPEGDTVGSQLSQANFV